METELVLSKDKEQNLSTAKVLLEAAIETMEASLSPSTRKMYRIDWNIFSEWCDYNKFNPLPASAETLCLFLTDQHTGGFAPATLIRRMAAIALAHERAGFDSPTKLPAVKKLMKGIKRTTTHEVIKKSAATVDRVQEMISHCPETLIGMRDKALLLLGFAGAFRRSELVALTINDIIKTDDGIKVMIKRSKTDQEGKGCIIAIPNGPNLRVVDNLFAWLKAGKITKGPLFRSIRKSNKVQEAALSTESVAKIIKRYAIKCGYNVDNFSGHSLRAGLITSAAKAGASINKIMEISRHSDINTLVGYVRNENLFENHAGEKFL